MANNFLIISISFAIPMVNFPLKMNGFYPSWANHISYWNNNLSPIICYSRFGIVYLFIQAYFAKIRIIKKIYCLICHLVYRLTLFVLIMPKHLITLASGARLTSNEENCKWKKISITNA